jgi:hypothetical protein
MEIAKPDTATLFCHHKSSPPRGCRVPLLFAFVTHLYRSGHFRSLGHGFGSIFPARETLGC